VRVVGSNDRANGRRPYCCSSKNRWDLALSTTMGSMTVISRATSVYPFHAVLSVCMLWFGDAHAVFAFHPIATETWPRDRMRARRHTKAPSEAEAARTPLSTSEPCGAQAILVAEALYSRLRAGR
jgi:hypothetical protein